MGVLYAPKAGKETREDIVTGALEAQSDKATVLAQQGRSARRSWRNKLRSVRQ